MKRFGFITNKFFLSALVLFCLLAADIFLHRGVSRTIIPSGFTEKIKPANLPVCVQPFASKHKQWLKDLTGKEKLENMSSDIGGISTRVYFDPQENSLKILDGNKDDLLLDSMVSYVTNTIPACSMWFKLYNLPPSKVKEVIACLDRLKNNSRLEGMVGIESDKISLLKQFCDAGYFTSYHIPSVNPYKSSENEIIKFINVIRDSLSKFAASSLSCSYYQYPALKKFFPNYPLVTSVNQSSLSFVSFLLKEQLEHDERIKIIFSPLKN